MIKALYITSGAGQGIENKEMPVAQSYSPQKRLLWQRDKREQLDGTNRLSWIDVCKGLAIILMILGHIKSIPATLYHVIFSFHMPLFMIINGYLIRSYDIRNVFSKSLKSLIKPYVIICFLEAIFAAVFSTGVDSAGQAFFDSLNDMIVGMSKFSNLFTQYHSVWLVWFVCCLFISRNLYVFIRSFCRKLPWLIQILIILAVSFLGVTIGKWLGFLPWSLDVAMASVVFIAFGDFLRNHQANKAQKIGIVVVAFFCWVLLLWKGVWIELATRSYPYDALCFICAIAGSVAMIVVSRGIDHIPLVSSFFTWAGKNSIVILGVHCLEMRFFKWDEWVYGSSNIASSWVIVFFLHLLLILIVSYLFTQYRKLIAVAR